MNLTLRHWLPTLALLITGAFSPLSAIAEQATAKRSHDQQEAAQTAVDQAADAAEEAADKAVESLNQETKLDLDFALDNHNIELDNRNIERVAAR